MAGHRAEVGAFTMSGINVSFGGITALSDVSLEVTPNQVAGVIGPKRRGGAAARTPPRPVARG
ncbi:MAG: hypothetical protein GEV00_06770, partial [Actinophytocola sp.]|nr:hypothetical protein [Actinophytocola sp.]